MRDRSVTVSSLIGMAFGLLWAYAGTLALVGPWRVWMLVVSVLLCVGFVIRLANGPAPTSSRSGFFRSTPYLVAVVLEVAAIALASAVLPRYGYAAYLAQVAGIIVGLHFLGLWIATQSRRVVWIAAAMCAVSAVGLFLPRTLGNGIRPGDVWTGFGNALVLWVGASRARAQ